ncbi:MAG: hypothetical protein R2741_09560 [Methanolobus sp.]
MTVSKQLRITEQNYTVYMQGSTPSYFDYVISEVLEYPDPICTCYQGIDTTEEGIDNAENLLMYLTMRKITPWQLILTLF